MPFSPIGRRLPRRTDRAAGFTLIEILVATVLTLMMMVAVAQVFSGVGNGISGSRRALEAFDRLRAAEATLRSDLGGVTASVNPSVLPETNSGYLEIVDSGNWQLLPPLGTPAPNGWPLVSTDPPAFDSANSNLSANPPIVTPDTTVGQRGDILMFTTRNSARPFTGLLRKFAGYDPNTGMPVFDTTNTTIQSDVAEVAWFLRGRTLHRRVLLLAPAIGNQPYDLFLYGDRNKAWVGNQAMWYAYNDISVRKEGSWLIPNSLADLTKRENRYAHPVHNYLITTPPSSSNFPPTVSIGGAQVPKSPPGTPTDFPFDVRQWGLLGLPTLQECSAQVLTGTNPPTLGPCPWLSSWQAGSTPFPCDPSARIGPGFPPFFENVAGSPTGSNNLNRVDLSSNVCMDATTKYWVPENFLSEMGFTLSPQCTPVRWADDVILTNVVGFDVKVWDPGAPVFSLTVNGQTKIVKPGDPEYDPDSGCKLAQNGALIGYGAYVDLCWGIYSKGAASPYPYPPPSPAAPSPRFSGGFWQANGTWVQRFGQSRSWMTADPQPFPPPFQGWVALQARVYDTWSTHYEAQGLPFFWWDVNNMLPPGLNWQDSRAGRAMNGFDERGDVFAENVAVNGPGNPVADGVVDSNDEQITCPPYPAPLRGIQVKIRVYEPDSRQIREVTVEQDFLPK